jgi:hypothetical protein
MPGHSLIQILRKVKFLVDSSYKASSPTLQDCLLPSFIQSFLRLLYILSLPSSVNLSFFTFFIVLLNIHLGRSFF